MNLKLKTSCPQLETAVFPNNNEYSLRITLNKVLKLKKSQLINNLKFVK
jgi:hypothetical protein